LPAPRSPGPPDAHSFPTRRSSDLTRMVPRSTPYPVSAPCSRIGEPVVSVARLALRNPPPSTWIPAGFAITTSARSPATSTYPLRSEEHTSELQSRENLVCRLLLEK